MLESRGLTVLFTDVKDFTQHLSHSSRLEGMDYITIHNELILPVLEANGGKIVKTVGDSFLVTFESPTNAVLAGMELQVVLRQHNESVGDPHKKFQVRVAIHTGELMMKESDVYGDAVNIASRILGIAEPEEVYFTEAVYLSMNRTEVPSSEIGYRYLKGIPERIRIYKVLHENPPNGEAAPHEDSPSFAFFPRPIQAERKPSVVCKFPRGFSTGMTAVTFLLLTTLVAAYLLLRGAELHRAPMLSFETLGIVSGRANGANTAIVEVGDKQRVVRVGDEMNGYTVASILSRVVVLQEGGKRLYLPLYQAVTVKEN